MDRSTRQGERVNLSKWVYNTTLHTQHGIPVYVFRLASLTGALQKELDSIPEVRRYQRMCVSLISPITKRLMPTHLASPSRSSCPALSFPSVPLYPTHPLPRPLRPQVHLPPLYHLSLQQLRLLTLAVSRLLLCGLYAATSNKPPNWPPPTIQKCFTQSQSSTLPPSSPPSGAGSRCAAFFPLSISCKKMHTIYPLACT